MNYQIEHATTYHYADVVSMSHNLAHLKARDCPGQTCLRDALRVSTPPAVRASQTDYFGNPATFFTVQEPHRSLTVSATNLVDVHPVPPPEPHGTPPWDRVPPLLRTDRVGPAFAAYEFTFNSPYVRFDNALGEYAAPSFPPGRPLLDAVLDLTRRIHADFHYDPAATTTATPLSEVLELRRGVCQDFAHLEIGCLRTLGLAARYVSGYLLTEPPAGQPRLIGADASHAWLSVFCPGFGWVDVDPTNNMIPSAKHITLAWGRDYDDVSPVKGVILGGGQHTVAVSVTVTPCEAPSSPAPSPNGVSGGPLAIGSSDGVMYNRSL